MLSRQVYERRVLDLALLRFRWISRRSLVWILRALFQPVVVPELPRPQGAWSAPARDREVPAAIDS
jgi:hypothetical protein